MSTLNIANRKAGNVTIMDLTGQIRLGETNINLHNAIRQLVDSGEKNVIVNLAGVTHIDSSGLGELVAGYTTIERSDGQMKLMNLSDRVIDLMTITKLFTVFDIYEDERSAIESFSNTAQAPSA